MCPYLGICHQTSILQIDKHNIPSISSTIKLPKIINFGWLHTHFWMNICIIFHMRPHHFNICMFYGKKEETNHQIWLPFFYYVMDTFVYLLVKEHLITIWSVLVIFYAKSTIFLIEVVFNLTMECTPRSTICSSKDVFSKVTYVTSDLGSLHTSPKSQVLHMLASPNIEAKSQLLSLEWPSNTWLLVIQVVSWLILCNNIHMTCVESWV